MTDEKRKVELRSDEVEDILGRVPAWLTRNGIFMLFIILGILLIGTWIFKIPDVKKAEIVVSSVLPPAEIEARTDGKVKQLFVNDNQQVAAGEVLAVIENPADYNDVMHLKGILATMLLPLSDIGEYEIQKTENAELGPIQSDYAAFYKNFRDYVNFILLDYHHRKIELLDKELLQYTSYSENLNLRVSILKEEFKLAFKQYQRDSTLFLQGVVSESSFEDTKAEMLTKRADWQEIVSLQSENKLKIAGIHEQILEMELKKQEQFTSLSSLLEESLKKLKGSIAGWEKKYLIVSPINGQVTFNKIWSKNQNVRSGDKVITVVPSENSELLGKIRLPIKGAGEVDIDQQVNIRFENYPYLKYGMVKGIVSNVSKVPQDAYYTVEVSLPDGLKTYYGYEIDFSQNMQGQAEIITEKMRLLQRIFNPVRNAISRQREM